MRFAVTIILAASLFAAQDTNTTNLRAGGSGYSLSFSDKRTDVIEFPDVREFLECGASSLGCAFAISLWLRLAIRGRDMRTAVSYGIAGKSMEMFALMPPDIEFAGIILGKLHTYTGSAVPHGEKYDGAWHHHLFTWNGDTSRALFFWDATLLFNLSVGYDADRRSEEDYLLLPHTFTLPGFLVLGQEQDDVLSGYDPNQAFLGQLDELRVWKRFFATEEEVATEMFTVPMVPGGNVPSKLIGYWSFDNSGAASSEVVDLTGRQPNGLPGGPESNRGAGMTPPRRAASELCHSGRCLFTGPLIMVVNVDVAAGLGGAIPLRSENAVELQVLGQPSSGVLSPLQPLASNSATEEGVFVLRGDEVQRGEARVLFTLTNASLLPLEEPLDGFDYVARGAAGQEAAGRVLLKRNTPPVADAGDVLLVAETDCGLIWLTGHDVDGHMLHARIMQLPSAGQLFQHREVTSGAREVTSGAPVKDIWRAREVTSGAPVK
ncbi:hypothetical protein CYMTET_21895 [Cymbomonas tetramitiformis]|uniref:Pentraxin (PTX) domain-containing protein n=1 Tax=Cymbomonas tetramitiformis TaxID=36881 RepID=A0AAE0L2U5_9CHLO|nr:hypothetical protein CYMTET_21895 [Cymbomonas tetramitiformis]